MSKLISTESSPMRFEKEGRTFVVTCMNVRNKLTKELVTSFVQGESNKSFHQAKIDMWNECKSLGIFNSPRINM